MSIEKLALNGGHPAKSKPSPDWPVYAACEITTVTEVLNSRQWWRGNGSQASNFEREFAEYHGAAHALAVTNGTQALELMLAASNIGWATRSLSRRRPLSPPPAPCGAGAGGCDPGSLLS